MIGEGRRLPPSRKTPSVSIVIVCWNSAAYLPTCLDTLSEQTFRDFETLLVDNASTDGSTDSLDSHRCPPGLKVKHLDSNVGFAAASNMGARLASGDWLVMLNPDAFPDPDWLRQLVLAAATHPNAFFASRQIQANRPHLLDGEGDIYYASGLALRANYNKPYLAAAPPREVFSACAAAAMYPRAEFLAAGGFDEDYFAYHEDVDLGFRLRLRGLPCFLVQAAVVRHVGAASTGLRSGFAVYHGHRNLVWTYVKNMPSPWFWLFLPLHLLANLVSIIYFILSGHARAIIAAKFDAIRGLRRALAKRRLVQAEIRGLPVEVIGHMNTHVFGPLEGWISRQRPPVDP